MDFALSPKAQEACDSMWEFMREHVFPAEHVWNAYLAEHGAHATPPIIEDLKTEARRRGLWNLFLPRLSGLSNLEYAAVAEISGWSVVIAPEAINCQAPDTGNMETLELFATPEQRERWLEPLLDGRIRSAFAMTEPAVASSDATNITTRITRDGDDYVINGRKWWITGVADERCEIFIVMGKTDPDAATHRQQSMVLVPRDTPGVQVVRHLPVFGYQDQHGHSEIVFEDARVPASNLLAGEGDGFTIAQARLGPGRIHHAMRAIGMAERALALMVDRAKSRVAFGKHSGRVRERPGLDRELPHRDRPGAPAGVQRRVAHRPARRQGREVRDRRRSRSPPPPSRSLSSTAPSRCSAPWASPTTPSWPASTPGHECCASSTAPTPSTAAPSPATSSGGHRPTSDEPEGAAMTPLENVQTTLAAVNPLDRFRLDDKVVVITGASSGLGDGFARATASVGATLVLAARRVDRLSDLAEELRSAGTAVLTRRTDVSVREECDELAAAARGEFGRIDVLINNAGVGPAGPALREDPEVFRRAIDVNLLGTYWMARACAPHMPEGSAIVNISSVIGMVASRSPQAHYSASKAGVLGLTRDLAQQWSARRGIRVNALCPGYFASEMTTSAGEHLLRQMVADHSILRRFGNQEELDSALLFLASSASSYMTGSSLVIDGGMSATV